MTSKNTSRKLRRSSVACSAAGIFIVGVIVALVSIVPFYTNLKRDQERNLQFALTTRTMAVEEYLSRVKDVAVQVTSRTKAREKLEKYNQGQVTLDELVNFSTAILTDSLNHSKEIVGISRLDRQGELAIQVGLPVPREHWPVPDAKATEALVRGPIQLRGKSYLVVGAPILDRQSQRVGTDIVLFELDRLKGIVKDYTGLGETGETVLAVVRDDRIELFFPLRHGETESDDRISKDSPLGSAVEAAHHGSVGIRTNDDDSEVIAYGPIQGSEWSIAVSMDNDELYAPVNRQIALIGGIIAVLILLGSSGMALLLRPLAGKMLVRADELEQEIQKKTAALRNEINERARVEKELRESEQKFRTISASAQDAIIMMDSQGDISYWNKAAEKIFRYAGEEVIGENLHQLLVPERALDVGEKNFERFRDTGQGHLTGKTIERTGTRKGGEEFPIELSLSTVKIKGRWHAIGIIRDITERKQMEEALRESEERYRAATEAALAGIGIVDPEENITFANLAFAQMLGYSQEELVGMNLAQLTDFEEFSRYQAATQRRKSGVCNHYETKLRHRDGSVVNVLVSASPLKAKDGSFEGTLGVVIDITERARIEAKRAQAEHEIEERRKYLEGVLAAAPDAIVTLDTKHRVVEWNPGAQRLFGYGPEEAIGHNLDHLVTHPAVSEEASKFTETVMSGKRVGPVETVRYRKDRSPVNVILAGSPILVGDALIGMVAIYTDITAQKQSERALREAHERFLTVLDGIDAHIYAADMESYEILFMNKCMRDDFGESLVGEICWKEFRGASEPCSHCTNDALLDTKGNPTGVHVWEGQNPITGTWYLNYDRAIKWVDGRLVRLQVATDITERKRAEEQLQRYAVELEQANAEIKQFAYIVSHDLRAPLINLKGFAAELRDALAIIGSAMIETLPHLDEKQRQNVTRAIQEDVPEALQFIEASVSRMDAFINAVLKLSRLGRRDLRLEPIDIETLVRANLSALAHQIEESGVRITVGRLPQVVADRTSMEQIWGNLLSNAVKYVDPDRPGKIEITAERADIAPDRQPDCLPDCLPSTSKAASASDAPDPGETTFHIRDNGRGIAADEIDKVFAPFRRAGKQDVPGEGMGLAYVQTLVRRHGGRIWCESEPGVGTTFSFTIPDQPVKGNPVRDTRHTGDGRIPDPRTHESDQTRPAHPDDHPDHQRRPARGDRMP